MSRRGRRKETTIYRDGYGRKKIVTEWKPIESIGGGTIVVVILIVVWLIGSC